MAHGYAGFMAYHRNLIQEGNIGLMKAIVAFDPKVGVKLISCYSLDPC